MTLDLTPSSDVTNDVGYAPIDEGVGEILNLSGFSEPYIKQDILYHNVNIYAICFIRHRAWCFNVLIYYRNSNYPILYYKTGKR